ncbi:restriction endonuclease subunit S [Fusobacterium periodonticum]|uniref:Type I restriction modification DNA specificity domain-containing protein n=1 Tax=Fusobacterium periodonticum ATCC 33693 TaxID=546275 RepID=D4CWY1_9FUSO|nr:restriction endonuclease subunit S [Fusobacterium periodonticum]EFE86141.1 hypothetical protein FUSPEROL_01940 [Fusobacterium periodonticum ATCC 33693]
MSKLTLDSVEWSEFKVGELFTDIQKGKCKNENLETEVSDNGISYISATNKNNGVSNFVKPNHLMQKGNCIMFVNQGDGGAGYSVYKSENFIATSSTSFGYAKWINKYTGIFVSTILSQLKSKYSFGYGRTEKRLKNDRIMLPIDKQGKPNWQFMEDYIKQEIKEQSQKIINYYENKVLKLGFKLLDLDVEWKEFKIKDIFSIKSVKGKTITNYENGNIPYISTSTNNNGLNNFINTKENISNKNCISIDPIGGKAFFHEYDFVGRGGAGSAINLLYNEQLNKYSALFVCKIIENNAIDKASYGIQLNGNRLKNLKIILPIDRDGNPHWEYMSKFIQNLEVKSIKNIVQYIYIQIKEKLKEYNLKNIKWKEYFIEEICDISSGKDIYEKERIEGKIPYITSTSNNNGIGYFISNTNETLDEHIISVNRNGSVGYSFYHNYKALFGNDTRKLKLKYQNEFVGKFISFMLLQQREKYGYGYKMGTARLKRQKIMLPSNINGNPNYDFMKKYMIIQEIKQIKKILDYYNF